MSYVIAGAGGFLGMDKHDVAIPVRQYAAEHRISHRNAAMAIGVQSVWRAKQTRGLLDVRVAAGCDCHRLPSVGALIDFLANRFRQLDEK